MERRVVITGLGITCPLGDGYTHETILSDLLSGTSGIVRSDDYAEYEFRSRVWAPVKDLFELRQQFLPEKKSWRFHGIGRTIPLIHVAAELAILDSGLRHEDIANDPKIGFLVGSGGPSTEDQVHGTDVTRQKRGPKRMGPFKVPPTMSSGAQAVLSVHYHTRGLGFSITSACSTSLNTVGEAYEKILLGRQKIVLAGGSDDAHHTKAQGFDAMPALSAKFNDEPQRASRAFDKDRAGFVDGEAGSILVLEELDHALARGAKIYGEIVGYFTTSDGHSMVEPAGWGAELCMKEALAQAGVDSVDYVNAHGTSTPVGDIKEIEALSAVFPDQLSRPLVTSTKSLTGHALGGAGGAELIYTLLMMSVGKIGPSANIDEFDPAIVELGWDQFIPREVTDLDIEYAMSNSFGFGGVNASVVLKRFSH